MKDEHSNSQETHLRVFSNRSEYHSEDGNIERFPEGVTSNEAKKRSKAIKDSLSSGYLSSIIKDLKDGTICPDITKVSLVTQKCLHELVDLVTSEVGRALIGLSVMQLCIKSISPEQNIRLHKGSNSKGHFSWIEGISMRSLDKNYVTPTLRQHNLLRLNADGFMMTRSLAENYPYSSLYKAQLRGAKEQWLALVEELENGSTDPLTSLHLFLSLLLNAAADFNAAADGLLAKLHKSSAQYPTRQHISHLMRQHSEQSDYAARLLEVSMHALMQSAVETGGLGELHVKPLSQMRSANKKHGNIGDIELLENSDIVESWDAKYGKGYLREEIEEALEKIPGHDHIQIVGFVTNVQIERSEEMANRISDIMALHSVQFAILTFDEWVTRVFDMCLKTDMVDEQTLSHNWLIAYAESLAQKRRQLAPIDEPCFEWVNSLTKLISIT